VIDQHALGSLRMAPAAAAGLSNRIKAAEASRICLAESPR